MPRDKTESHKRIIEAAKKEFMEYGFADASLRRIAAETGIQVGGLYNHFASKDEMFDSLVEPAIRDFHSLYHEMEQTYFSDTHTDSLENNNESSRMMALIYDHLDEFKLLIMKSQGSRYEDFLHETAKLEEEVTLRYLELQRSNGCPVNDVDRTEFHLLTTSYIESFFQPVTHGLNKEQAMHYAATLEQFYQPAWKQWLGI